MLPQLNADPIVQVNVQQTAFSHDVLGRWVCSSWPEVSGNGGDPFDVVVIGAGMFGGYLADKLYRRGENLGLRILIVEAGSFLVPTHVRTSRDWEDSMRQPSRWWRTMLKIPDLKT